MTRTGGCLIAGACAGAILSGACATTTNLDHVVVAYDMTSQESITKLLLLNIARAQHNLPMHFTGISSVVATYRFTFSGGVTPAGAGNIGFLPVPTFQASTEENPTVSIAPMQGDEFTQRLLTPFPEAKLTLLLRQGYDVDTLFRLLGAEVRLATGDEHRVAVSANRPANKTGYATFRRVVAHLSSIQDRDSLFIEPLHYQVSWTVPEATVTPEAYATTYKDFTLAYDPANKVYHVTKRINGRVMITNYDPSILSNEERFRLHVEADEVPFNDVLVDIRAGHTGGEYPMHGTLRLRSFHEVLTFVGRGIGEEPEYDVPADPRTPRISENPARTLDILISRADPGDVSVVLDGYHYSVRAEHGYQWNKKAFSVLYQLFQMSVSTAEHVGPGITIAK